MPLASRRVLLHARIACQDAYFIEEGLVSVFAAAGARIRTEVWLIGNEGMVGLPLVLGAHTSPHRRVVQLGGTALRIAATDLREALSELAAFRQVLLRYAHAVLVQSSQIGACNSSHPVDKRVARWLLMARERCKGDVLPLTHDMLARVLGVRRATITECVGRIEKQGLVAKERGAICILDRARLESVACACYHIVQSEYRRLLSDGPARIRPPTRSALPQHLSDERV